MATESSASRTSVDDAIEKIIRQQHGDILVLIDRQAEINRRVGSIEAKQDRVLALEVKVEDLEGQDEKTSSWRTFVLQNFLTPIITMVAIWAAAKLGVPLIGP